MGDERTFEQKLERLEEIVRLLEAGELTLDASLALFGEGIALARELSAELQRAEARIEEAVRASDGGVTVVAAPGRSQHERD